jgi:hypothetical protein
MQNTTWSTISALESITSEFLTQVSGGCGGHKHCSPCPQPAAAPVQQVQILQLPAAPAAAPLPAPQPSLPEVSTSVSINGQARA